MNRLKLVVCAVVAVVPLAACDTAVYWSASVEETITRDEAAEKVQEHIDNAVAAPPDEAEPKGRGGPIFAACDDPTDGGSRDRVTVSNAYWIRGLPVEDNEQNVELLYEYWTANGYRVLRDERPDKLSIAVQHEEDFFWMSLRVSDQGSLSLNASSPCVWPEGTPNP